MLKKRYQLNPGTILDNRYVIHGVLGEGGFGITYDARNRHLGTRVAIKELFCGDYMSRDADVSNDATLFDSRVMERFEKDKKQFLREAHILKSFTHEPGIVSVMDFFESNNTAYIVMNYLDGTTLREFVESTGPMNYKALLMSFKPLLDALQKVHNAGLVHGDISPDNIMLLSDGSLRLIDFGASYKYDKKTSSYVINVGKSGYSAPEQYSDESLVGPRADIYSISATLFYCMTSKDPESSISRMLLNSERMAPSDMGIDIPKEVDALICMGLSIKPEGRFSSAMAMKEAMNKALVVEKQPRKQPEAQPKKQEGRQTVKEQRVEKKTERQPQISRPIIGAVAVAMVTIIGLASMYSKQEANRNSAEVAGGNYVNTEHEEGNDGQVYQKKVFANLNRTLIIDDKGKVHYTKYSLDNENWNPEKWSHYENIIEDGEKEQEQLSQWGGIVDIAFSYNSSLTNEYGNVTYDYFGLDSNGKILVARGREKNTYSFDDWDNIVSIEGGSGFVVGLKNDGKVLISDSAGYSHSLEEWEDIKAINASGGVVLGLKKDNTLLVHIFDGSYYSNTWFNSGAVAEVESWSGIICASTSGSTVTAVKEDGTILATNLFKDTRVSYESSKLVNIAKIIDNTYFIIGITENGEGFYIRNEHYTISQQTGEESGLWGMPVNEWKNLEDIDGTTWGIVGLQQNGSILSVESDSYQRLNSEFGNLDFANIEGY